MSFRMEHDISFRIIHVYILDPTDNILTTMKRIEEFEPE